MILLVQLRWIAVIGQIVAIATVQFLLGIPLPLGPMVGVLSGLVLLNLASLGWLRRRAEVSSHGLLLALMLDVAALTAQLYLSGGATNPFAFIYLLQVTLAAVLLERRATWAVAVLASASFAGLVFFNRPLAIGGHHIAELMRLHIAGTLVCFALDAALLVVFASRMMQNLHERDARLAALKEAAVEEDHIVRMGLLASGAAHELGTPLALMSVILSDWQRMSTLAASAEISQDIGEMQAALQRCKKIVTGILLSFGEARGEAPRVTTVDAFLTELVTEWRASRAALTLEYRDEFGDDVPIVSDSALKQVIFNVLDNAFEASPGWVRCVAERDGDSLVLHVSDAGPGFPAEMLEHLGRPYCSSKGRLGGGLGLFLVVNVVRKLGGTVSARNRDQGGAIVTLSLPLTLAPAAAHAHDPRP
ncbi:MAG: HAMP domain-containing histidine kinase [Gammaproteobacteria bacterium]|nr:HAMP domain-containing histidine kinase [Gammaproteobacteria bacterium]